MSPYGSLKESIERDRIYCAADSNPVEDLKRITVPVSYAGAEGGFGSFGSFGLYSTKLPGSWDVSSRSVSFETRPLDFGHADLFLADEAPAEVWPVIGNGLAAH